MDRDELIAVGVCRGKSCWAGRLLYRLSLVL